MVDSEHKNHGVQSFFALVDSMAEHGNPGPSAISRNGAMALRHFQG
jgi:hypothetical protein